MENQKKNKNEKTNNNTEKKEHVIEHDTGKPDFMPEKEKIKGPSHASSSQDKVELGLDANEIEYNPFHSKN